MGLSLVGLVGLGTGHVALEHGFFCVWRHLVASPCLPHCLPQGESRLTILALGHGTGSGI